MAVCWVKAWLCNATGWVDPGNQTAPSTRTSNCPEGVGRIPMLSFAQAHGINVEAIRKRSNILVVILVVGLGMVVPCPCRLTSCLGHQGLFVFLSSILISYKTLSVSPNTLFVTQHPHPIDNE